jgi:hypothetical protein
VLSLLFWVRMGSFFHSNIFYLVLVEYPMGSRFILFCYPTLSRIFILQGVRGEDFKGEMKSTALVTSASGASKLFPSNCVEAKLESQGVEPQPVYWLGMERVSSLFYFLVFLPERKGVKKIDLEPIDRTGLRA